MLHLQFEYFVYELSYQGHIQEKKKPLTDAMSMKSI